MSSTHIFAIPPGATGPFSRAALRQGPRAFGEPPRKKPTTRFDDDDEDGANEAAAAAGADEGAHLDRQTDEDHAASDIEHSKPAIPDHVDNGGGGEHHPADSNDDDDDDDDRTAHILARAAARLRRVPGPPLYNAPHLRGRAPGATPHGAGAALSARHAGALAALLHTALLRGDFSRARRAWALLLRGAAAGPAGPAGGGAGVDLRGVDNYAIGAEVLLRAAAGEGGRVEKRRAAGEEEGEALDEAGFAAARRYYEALAAEYSDIQHRRRNFFSALFSVWLFQAVERGKRRRRAAAAASARRHKRDRYGRRSDEDGDDEYDDDNSDAMDVDADDDQALRAADDAELLDAREIGERFDAALDAPQHLDNLELLRLRSHVHAWTADLIQRRLDAMDPGNVDEDDERQRLFDDLDKEKSQEQAMLARAKDLQDDGTAR
jgi:hypothetical protein